MSSPSNIRFSKYQGTGNDFVILDNRTHEYDGLNTFQVRFICDRRFGVGADGLMLLNQSDGYDFQMVYYNSDGRESSMCGNGGRCLVRFAKEVGINRSQFKFIAIDGVHEATINDEDIVRLKMKDVTSVKDYHGDFLLDTGSPHYVRIVHDVKEYEVYRKGKEIRYSSHFAPDGINVNFVDQLHDDSIYVRTYERGVEDETLSCGTGVTASAIVCYHNENGYNDVTVLTPGGRLNVEYDRFGDHDYQNIWLSGPAVKVFEGTMKLPGDQATS